MATTSLNASIQYTLVRYFSRDIKLLQNSDMAQPLPYGYVETYSMFLDCKASIRFFQVTYMPQENIAT